MTDKIEVPQEEETKQGEAKFPPLNKETVAEARDAFDSTVMLLLSDSNLISTIKGKQLDSGVAQGRYFYAHFISRMRKIYTNTIPTAGVSITDGINLYINPEFWVKLETIQRIEVLIHECEHLIHFHPKRFLELENEQNHKLYNVAADATINGKLKSLHEFGVTVPNLNKNFPKLKFMEGDSSEDHYYKLMQEKEKLEEMIKNGEIKMVDDHSKWGEMENEEYGRSILIDAMQKSVKAAGAGNTPSDVLRELDALLKSHVNWKQVLRQFVCRMMAYKRSKSRMKRNRRYGVIFQGKKKEPELVLTLLLDESGSVDDAQFTQFWAEMEKIYPQVAELNIINFDAKVNKVYTYKKGMKIVRTGQGGTMFGPAFEEAKKMKSDAVIVFTDGYPCDEVSKPKFPVLWASTQRDERPFEWGKFVKVPVVEEK